MRPRLAAASGGLIAVFLALGAPSPASAQPPAEAAPGASDDERRAIALYEQGLRHYELAEFAAAIDSFKASYRLVADPELLFNIAQAYRRMGPTGCAQALEFYRNYRVAAPDRSADVEEHIAAMERCVVEREQARATGEPPPPRPPGAREGARPSSPAAGGVSTRSAAGGQHRSRWPEIAIAAAGVGTSGLGAWLVVDAGDDADDLWARCGSACDRDEVDAVRRRARAGTGLLIGGVAAVAVAGVLWWVRGEEAARPAITVAPDGAGVSLLGAF